MALAVLVGEEVGLVRRGGAPERGSIVALVALDGLVGEEVGLVGEREYLTGKAIQQQSCLILLTFNLIFFNTMAKIVPMDLVKSMSGKICEHSDISFARRGDTQYTMKRCNERTSEPSEAELAQRTKFATISAAVNARLKANAPEDVAGFQSQKKYKTMRKYLWVLESEKLG